MLSILSDSGVSPRSVLVRARAERAVQNSSPRIRVLSAGLNRMLKSCSSAPAPYRTPPILW